MTTQTEALKQARSVISSINRGKQHALTHNKETVFWQREEWVQWALDEVLPLIEEALAQPEQEPVAILNHAHGFHTFRNVKLKGLPDGEYLVYTTSPQRTWVWLTDDEVIQIRDDMTLDIRSHVDFYRHCEAKLKEKNI